MTVNMDSDDRPLKRIKINKKKITDLFKTALAEYALIEEHLPLAMRRVQVDESTRHKKPQKEESEEDSEVEHPEPSQSEAAETEDVEHPKKTAVSGRAKTISELQERLAKLRGKSVNAEGLKLKKGLKNRLKKKQKLEERRERKKLAKRDNAKGNMAKGDAAPAVEDKKVKEKPGPILYSKFQFEDDDKGQVKRETDPKRILQKIEKSQSKLKSFEEKGLTEKAARVKNKITWDSAIQKAEGVKVRDDVEMLKKTIKRKNQQKNRSKKAWDERNDTVTKKKEEGQKKRKENLNRRKQQKKAKKIKLSARKGRVVI